MSNFEQIRYIALEEIRLALETPQPPHRESQLLSQLERYPHIDETSANRGLLRRTALTLFGNRTKHRGEDAESRMLAEHLPKYFAGAKETPVVEKAPRPKPALKTRPAPKPKAKPKPAPEPVEPPEDITKERICPFTGQIVPPGIVYHPARVLEDGRKLPAYYGPPMFNFDKWMTMEEDE